MTRKRRCRLIAPFVTIAVVASFMLGRPAEATHGGSPIEGWWDGWSWVSQPVEGTHAKQRMAIWGWTATNDYPTTALGVRVTINGWPVDPDWDFANVHRPDVAAVFPHFGPWHGFAFTINMPRIGPNVVCVQAQYAGHYHDLPGNGCRWIGLNEWPQHPTVPYSTARWDRFRYSDPTLRLKFQMGHVSGTPFTAPQWDILRNSLVGLEASSWSRVDFTEGPIGPSDRGITLQKVNAIPGTPATTEGALTNVKFTNCPDWNLGSSPDFFNTSYWVGCYARQATVQYTDHLLGYPPNIASTGSHEIGHGLLMQHQVDHIFSVMCVPVCPATVFSWTDQITLSEVYRW